MGKALEEGKLLEVVSVVRETLEAACSAKVSVAVIGDSCNGVSSFVNVLRGLGHEEETSAPTGVVRTTQIPTSYSSSRLPNVMLWDRPGMGAAAQSLENHLGEMPFSQYDLFIITASEQFSMNHVKLAKTIQGLGKRFSIVWTKLDRDLSTSVLSEDQLLQNIWGNIWENLQKEGYVNPPRSWCPTMTLYCMTSHGLGTHCTGTCPTSDAAVYYRPYLKFVTRSLMTK
ncbi:immunity-related GTPase family M protein-like [Manis pentadactyla]|uniref:immunity-related GTPase family M protein-like n=1 Tax=Manis pentadactyla TaxID=143292 RepID=UPI00255CA8DC|nr:immunity-related GTPase family M protein-like [Manis pentadactyla]